MENLTLPESLSSQLRGFQRKLRTIEGVTAGAAAFSIVAAAFTCLYLSDRLWDTPVALRLLLSLCGAIPVLYVIFYAVNHIFLKRRDFKTLSVLVQKHHRKLGDSLLGVVELAENKDLSENVSRELCSAAISNIAEKTKTMDFGEAISRTALKRFFIWSLAMAGLVTCLVLFTRPAFSNTMSRWLNPLSEVERFTFVKITGIPSRLTVPHGEEFEIKCSLAPDSSVKPSIVRYRCGMEPVKAAVLSTSNGTVLKFAGQSKPVAVEVWAGDFKKKVKVTPVHRPVLLNLEASVKLPEYTGRKESKVKVSGKTFNVLEGSQFTLLGQADRELRSAEMLDASGKHIQFKTSGSSFISAKMDATPSEKNIISWKDSYGMSPLHDYELSILPEKDQEPFTECPRLPQYSAMLAEETLIIRLSAEDDYGVAELGAAYSASDPKFETRILASGQMKIAKGAPDRTSLESEMMFCPKLLKIPEQTLVTLCSTATDYYPGRSKVLSRQYKIYVLSLQEHAKLLEEELDSIMGRLEDLVWREEENLEKNKNISKMDKEEMKKDDTTEKISEQKEAEKMNAEDLEKLSEKGMKLLEEALRNKEFPAKTLKEWAKMLETSKAISQKEMKSVEKSLENAMKGSKRPEDMDKAVKEQQELVEKLKELMKKMDDSLNNLTMENFVGRLNKEAENEKKVSSNLTEIMKTSVGMDENSLPEKVRKDISDEKARQEQIRKSVRRIQDDLLSFFSRTRIKKYQDVADDMEKEKIQRTFEETVDVIEKNQTAKGISNANMIAAKLEKWAKELGQKGNQKSPKSGQGEGEMQPLDPELTIGLLRLIQQEQELREQTRNLDENKQSIEDYGEKAQGLSEKQMAIRRDLNGLKPMAAPCPNLGAMMDRAGKAMTDAGALLFKPQTDGETIAAETEVIELLTGAFQESSENMADGGAGMMSLMQMMMGGQGGSKPGGFKGAISSNAANMKIGGPEYKVQLPEGKSDRTAGKSVQSLPEEYKDAIESYYRRANNVERKGK